MIVFDVDGVLVDTANLISLSYRLAGATPPANVMANEGHHWLIDQVGASSALEIWTQKNSFYLRGLREVALLPPLRLAQLLCEVGESVAAVTAAPIGTIGMLKQRVKPWPFVTATDGMRVYQKMRFLPVLDAMGVYVDDQDRSMHMPEGWRFVHYTGQTIDKLYEEIAR